MKVRAIRRPFIRALFLALVMAVAAMAARAQDVRPAPDPREAIAPDAFRHEVQGRYVPVPLVPVDVDALEASLLRNLDRDGLNPGAELCEDATEFVPPAGSQTIVNGFAEEPSDPAFSCLWGDPPGPRGDQGYRTAWFKLVAPITGRLIVEAHPNADYRDNYDTIIGIYLDPAATPEFWGADLAPLGCNDDTNGFLSRATAVVEAGRTYYIEVADWHFGLQGDGILNLTAVIDDSEVGFFWNRMNWIVEPRSRHVVVADGDDLYIVAGMSAPADNIRSARVHRYNTTTDTWTKLAIMPGPDNKGYANTTGVFKNGRIYIPSGYVGDVDDYDGTHWFYDVATNSWDTLASVPWADGPTAYAATANPPPEVLPGYFVTGGIAGEILTSPLIYRDLWYYQPGTNIWVDFTPMTIPRYAHAAAWVDGKVCVVGGISLGATHVLEPSGECYDIVSLDWTPIASLNEGRFNHGSAVGPDGRWYVFGGTRADGTAVDSVEVYDPATDTWTKLDFRYNLDNPPRTWPRGAFVDNTLWIVGGETAPGGLVVPLIETLEISTGDEFTYFPFVSAGGANFGPGITFADANFLALNVPEYHRFVEIQDVFDVFYFDTTGTQVVTIRLDDIAETADYDFHLYNANKFHLAQSDTPFNGAPESVTITLPGPERYYIIVIRAFPVNQIPPPDQYRIVVQTP